ncbi:NAD(P)-dependent oxidoreductase [Synechococcus sp. HJ21-Hayes]|uniref:NAD(P)-dependent oxidoreductase n=1 Tax=unclassified Synechococcus TaxID=2626047 RepID=UPI0020CB8253|nr:MULTISPECIES: NAD(P)-dependent oxidoreductase [unclassified Synechococcus]MCP9830510.1 NAD(P)-dependent oxidoreductase [Synechococcus sp. JJ3a-Johnson]MCP9852300.1 NAD(P)-dependent oxidoreductase [Synechococcus sp. HJ21-Hayes]
MPAPSLPSVAFLGLGCLGQPMAANLLRAGVHLTVHNRTRVKEEALAAEGAQRAATPAAAVAEAEVVMLCLSDDAAVVEVLAAAPLRPGALVIDTSTIGPATSRRLAQQLQEQGVAYLDAPVTGGTEGAKAGTLSVLVGGGAADLERARPLLEVIGRSISHFGSVGCGQEAKAVNQVLVAGSYAAVAEALALAQRLGLPQAELVEALRQGAAGSWALEHRSRQMIENTYPLGFRLALHHKDLTIALEAAAGQQLDLPITAQVAAMEAALLDAGHGDEDVSALARWFQPRD